MVTQLKAEIRDILGKKIKNLRKKGFIPAELYGHNVKNLHLAVSEKEFSTVFKKAGESSIINLVIEDNKKNKEIPVLIHDTQNDYLTNKIIHIDFYEVKMTEKIRTYVPLEFVGESEAVKNYGGILNKSMLEIEIECLPKDLPQHIVVDLSILKELNQNIYVKDLKIPQGVKPLVDLNTVVATVIEPKEEMEAGPVDISEVKVESEEKVAERVKSQEDNLQ